MSEPESPTDGSTRFDAQTIYSTAAIERKIRGVCSLETFKKAFGVGPRRHGLWSGADIVAAMARAAQFPAGIDSVEVPAPPAAKVMDIRQGKRPGSTAKKHQGAPARRLADQFQSMPEKES